MHKPNPNLRALVMLVCALWCGATLTTAATVCAPSLAEAQERDPRYRVFVRQPVGFYADPAKVSDDGRVAAFSTEALGRAFEARFRQDDARFKVLPQSAVFEVADQAAAGRRTRPRAKPGAVDAPALTFPSARETLFALNNAQSELSDGLRALTRYDLQSAEESFLSVIATYERLIVPLLEPRLMARVYEYLGLVYAEQPDARDKSIEAFRQMLRLNPRRVLAAPFFPDPIVRMYREARTRLLASRADGPNADDLYWLRRLALLVDADIVAWSYVVQDGDRLELVAHLYRADTDEALKPERIPLTSTPGRDRERADRLAGRFVACVEPLPIPPPPDPDRERDRWYLGTGVSYITFNTNPAEQFFGNFGVSVQSSYMATDTLALNARLAVHTSSPDADASLLNEFVTVRAIAGPGFAFRWRALRPFVTLGFEGTYAERINYTDNFFCKVDPLNPLQCPPGSIETRAPGWLMGVNGYAGLSVRIIREFSVFLAGTGSFYFFPFTGRALDLPYGGESGFEYRF